MLAEEIVVLEADSASWQAMRPLLDAALRLERDDIGAWHGWTKQQISQFLEQLPTHCTLLVGVWSASVEGQEHEMLVASCVCEVVEGQIQSLRPFESLIDNNVPSVQELEPGFEHALQLMRAARAQVAPVAWALFTNKLTWDEWILTDDKSTDKDALLTTFAHQGRCVLMGSQTQNHRS